MGIVLVDNKFLPQAKTAIEGARKTIDIATFKAEVTAKPRGIALQHFFKSLITQSKKQVKVRFLLNWNTERASVAKTNLYVMTELKKLNLKIRFLRNNRCCHAKLIIVDNEIAIFGSHNLSVRSCHNNFELSYFTQEKETVEQLSDIFSHSWADAKKF